MYSLFVESMMVVYMSAMYLSGTAALSKKENVIRIFKYF